MIDSHGVPDRPPDGPGASATMTQARWQRGGQRLRGCRAEAIARPPAEITIHGASVASRSRESIGPCRSQWKASG
jgi:hypothetical protein